MFQKARKHVQNHPQASVFSLALLLRLAWLSGFLIFGNDKGAFTYDSKGYWQLAESLANDNQFGRFFDGVWYDEYFRTPLYPAFLSFFKIIHAPLGILLSAQALLSALTCAIITRLANEMGFGKNTSVLAGLLAAIDLTSILFSNYVLTETLFTFLLTSGFFLFYIAVKRVEALHYFWSGALFGLSMLCRPAGSFLPILLLPFILFSKGTIQQKIKHVLVYSIACLLIISPWLTRNYMLSKRLFLSTSMQELFLLCPTAHVYGSIHNVSMGKARLALWKEMYDKLGDRGINDPLQRGKVEQDINLRMLKQHPFAYLKDYALGAAYFAFKPSGAYWNQQVKVTDHSTESYADNELQIGRYGLFAKVMTALQLLQLIVLWTLVSYGLYRLWKSKQVLAFLFISSTMLYFTCMVPGSSAEGRFRIPAMAFIAVAAAVGVNAFSNKSSASKSEDEIDETR